MKLCIINIFFYFIIFFGFHSANLVKFVCCSSFCIPLTGVTKTINQGSLNFFLNLSIKEL